jgi:tetratricopeptide (TPR) repeat protein
MKRKNTLPLIVFYLFVCVCGEGVFALDLHIRPRGFTLIPIGEASAEAYTAGGGGGLLFDVDFSSLWPNPIGLGYAAGLEAALGFAPLASGGGESLSLFSGGLGVSAFYYPFSRAALRLDAAFGLYQGTTTETSGSWYYRAGLEAGFRFTPNFILSFAGGWKYFNNAFGGSAYEAQAGKDAAPAALYQGLYAGLTAQIIIELKGGGERAEGISLAINQEDAVYPAYLGLYQSNPAATLVIRNNESAEIRNLRISFRAGNYTASEFPCGNIERLGKGQSIEMPLYADFSPALLEFTESGRIIGEVVARYTMLGASRESVRSASVQVHNRNTAIGGGEVLAAFVSPTASETLEYAKAVVGMARTSRRYGLNQNVQFVIWLYESLRAAGVGLREEAENAEAQYPPQTLAYKSGASRDIALLYAALLEASGISSALVPLEGDYIVAVSLNINEAAAATLFNGTDNILIVNNTVWLPLSMKALPSGFSASWTNAAKSLGEAFAAGESVDFIVVADAWAKYPPAAFPALGVRIGQPDSAALGKAAEAALNAYVASDITPLITQTQRQIQAGPAAALYNRLGILQIRAGRLADAKASFERAAGMGSAAAITNRGNIALQEKDYSGAERWFRQALSADSENAAAKRGLEQTLGAR